MSDGADWRLQGQENYLAALEWTPCDYFAYRKGWDHDHCEFCGIKFSVGAAIADSIGHGYTAKDGYYWVCVTCFEDFRDRFGWRVRGEPAQEPGER